ncbi:acyltransferase [Streptomyces badius]
MRGAAPRAVGRLSDTLYLEHWTVTTVTAEIAASRRSTRLAHRCTLAAHCPGDLATMRGANIRFVEADGLRTPAPGHAGGGLRRGPAGRHALGVGTTTLRPPARPPPRPRRPAGRGRRAARRADRPALAAGPVVPRPAQARADFPPDWGCQAAPAVTSSPPCLFGAVDSPDRVVLLGDSHAGQWFSPLLALASRRGWALLEELVSRAARCRN